MKYTFWGMGFIMAGLLGVVFIVLFESITINNESEYYTLKEAMEAAMLESVDVSCYRTMIEDDGCGGDVVKISEQKFVENFTRRFAENISGDVKSYTIDFYDIIESPPKATVVITGTTQKSSLFKDEKNIDGTSFEIKNTLSGILEYYKVGDDYITLYGKGEDVNDYFISYDELTWN